MTDMPKPWRIDWDGWHFTVLNEFAQPRRGAERPPEQTYASRELAFIHAIMRLEDQRQKIEVLLRAARKQQERLIRRRERHEAASERLWKGVA